MTDSNRDDLPPEMRATWAALCKDVEVLEAGGLPAGVTLASLPTLTGWAVSADGRDGYDCLVGIVHGHPKLADGATIRTSAIAWYDGKRRLLRTINTLYRLEESLSEAIERSRSTSH